MSSRIALAGLIAAVVVAAGGPAGAQQPAKPVSLSPDKALQTTMAHNPELRGAVVAWRRARLEVVTQDYQFVPDFFAQARYSGGRRPTQAAGGGVSVLSTNAMRISTGLSHRFRAGTDVAVSVYAERSSDQSIVLGDLGQAYGLGASFEITQPWLRDFGRDTVLAELHIARLRQNSALAARDQLAADLAEQVLTGYWSLWLAQKQVAIEQAAGNVARRQLERARQRLAAGVYSAADLIALKTELGRIQGQIVTRQAAVDDQGVELARLMGADAASAGWSAATTPPTVGSPPALSEALATARRRSYRLDQLHQAVDVARVEANVADNRALPRLDTNASLGVSGLGGDVGGAYDQISDLDGVNGFVNLRVELPIVDTGLEAAARRARLGVDAAQADLHAAQNALRARLAGILNQMRAAGEQLDVARQTLKLAERQIEVQTTLVDNGKATMFDVVEAIQQQREAQLRVAQSRVELARLQVRLRRAMGTLLEQVGVAVAADDGQ